jgi:hypothetical protein
MEQEAILVTTREFMNSQLKRAFFLSRGPLRMKVEPDSSLSYLRSSDADRLLFGRGAVEIFKVQAGLLVPLRLKEMRVRLLSPTSAEFSCRPQDQPQFSYTTSLTRAPLRGYTRRVGVTNRSSAPLHIRALTLSDPSSLNFRKERDPPGEIGMNAFNRGDHVVMDDVGDTTGARVVGFSPRPSAIYMTTDRQRVLDLFAAGELPEMVSGISGAVMILAQQEADVPSGGSAEFLMAALYESSSLETALAGLSSLLASGMNRDGKEGGNGEVAGARHEAAGYLAHSVFGCSNPAVSFAFAWAKAALHCIEGEEDLFERLCAGVGLGLVRPDRFELDFEATRSGQRKDGFISRYGSAERGPLETALFIMNSCFFLALRGDKKLTRKWYSSLRRAGAGLMADAEDGLVHASASGPDGWRRRLGSGFPTGVTSEVNLAVARALNELATLAYAAGKGSDSATFREANVKMVSSINERLRDAKTGNLALNIYPKGRVHAELTVDQAVGLYYYPFDHNLASSTVQRMLERDFESGLGPRCVPTSNSLYFHPTYGEGQLGSCWTRASLAHAVLAYRAGYPNIGGLQLEKVARIVYSDWEKFGGVPGEFPYWFSEPERRLMDGSGSDPVAAARFVESVVFGELGVALTPQGARLKPPSSSQLRWASMHEMILGEKGSVFVGRSSGKIALIASNHPRAESDGLMRFLGCRRLAAPAPIEALIFWDRSTMLVCVGSSDAGAPGSAAHSWTLTVPVGGEPFASSLFVEIGEFNQEAGLWNRPERKRLAGALQIRVELKPGAWRAFRLAPANKDPVQTSVKS